MHRLEDLDLDAYRLPPESLDRIITPALVIHLDRVRENLTRMGEYLGGDLDRWRPHLKTAKIPSIFAMLIQAGLRSFKCATTREAMHVLLQLEEAGVVGGDVLVAYPSVGPARSAVGRLAEQFPQARVSLL